MSIEVRHISKRFGSFTALDDVSLSVGTGELVALLGPSGSGKTTLLRIVAGLEQPDEGSGPVLFHDEDVRSCPANARGVGFVFQHYALFRHMTVFENVAFGLRVRPRRRRPSKAAIGRRVHDLLALVQLEGLAARYPHQLSGGQRQRVALARALAVEPKVLLLDEPFGALDAKVRQELRRWLRRLHAEIHLTSVFVTHDQEEALELADRVVVMNAGRVEQAGTPEAVVERPATPFVANFLGRVNIFHGRVQGGRAHLGPLAVDYPEHPYEEARAAVGYARPHELDIGRVETGGGLWATVHGVRAAGAVVRLELEAPATPAIQVEVGREQYDRVPARPGERLYVRPRRVRVFMGDVGARPTHPTARLS
jgi:sulfate/thiosulfate transport system ATP-binding protein